MEVSVATSVWILFAVVGAWWLFTRFSSVPLAYKELEGASAEHLPVKGANLAALQVWEGVLRGAFIALAVMLALAVALDLYAGTLPNTDDGLASLVSARNFAETVFGWAEALSWWIWLILVGVLAVIWYVTVHMGAQKRWEKALESRRSAIREALAGMDGEDLARMSAEEAPERAAILLEDLRTFQAANEQAKLNAQSEPVLRLETGDGPMLSLAELHAEIDALRQEAAALRERGEGGDSDAEADALEERASIYAEQVPSIEQQIRFDLASFDGTTAATLSDVQEGPNSLFDWDSQLAERRRDMITDARLENHEARALDRNRPEPEIWREWIAAAATSETSVKSAGFLARHAKTIALATFFIGFVGFGASADTSEFIGDAREREVEMTLAIGDQELDAATRTAQAAPDPEVELASDEQTEERLRRAMRNNLARNLLRGVVTGRNAISLNASQRAGLRGLGARQGLLSNASRPAASPRFGGDANARVLAEFPDSTGAAGNVDEIFDRRIKQLKDKPDVWRKLRASASRPARPDLISKQLLSATLSDNAFANTPAFRKVAERSTAKFAADVAKSGDIPRNLDDLVPNMHSPGLYSARDKRMFADFQREAPGRLDKRINAARSGKFRVGSLFRSVPSADGNGMSRRARGTRYADVFPDTAKNSRFGFASGITNKASPRVKASGGGGGIRFRRIRKGVILAAEPDNADALLPLESFEWNSSGSNITFTLKPENGESVTLGGFDPETVHTALAFAADGRPDLASMPKMMFEQGDYVLDTMSQITNRLVLHPAIQDTDLACNAINLDRFVDVLMKADLAGTGTGALLEAWKANEDLSFATVDDDPEGMVGKYAQSCGTGASCFPIETYSAAGLGLGGYSSYLQCKARGDTACYAGGSKNGFAMTSIVDEQPYSIAPDLAFLTGENAGDQLWPFAFTMRAVPLSMDGEELTFEDGFRPWDFPAVKDDIRQMVEANVRADTAVRSIFNRMRDFAVLQRMFKLALDGRFGPDFPFERLMELQESTKSAVTVDAAGHWDLYPVYQGRREAFGEFMNEEASKMIANLQTLAETGNPACQLAAGGAILAQRSRPLPNGPGLWDSLDRVLGACRGSGSGSLRSLGAHVSRLQSQDLVDDAVMLGKGGFNTELLTCPAR